MKKAAVWIILLVVLVGATTVAFHLGKNSAIGEETAGEETPGEVTPGEITPGEGTDMAENEQNGVILFKIEGYTIKDDGVVLVGKKFGAFLRWTPDEDFVTTSDIPAEFEVPNKARFDYYEWVDFGTVKVTTGSSSGHYFSDIYEKTLIKPVFIYLHVQDGKVVYIQQALDVDY